MIFGFGGNALIATSFHVMQRTGRARLPDQLSPWFVLLGFNLFCIVAASGYLMGVTQSKEYAEPEWYADIWLVVVWVVYFVLYPPHARPLQRASHLRRQLVLHGVHPGVAVLHIVNNLAVPASFGAAKSYSAFSGVQDAMTQWWYGHNAVAFFLTAVSRDALLLSAQGAERPIYSYRLSILSFWGITFFYMWVGSHHCTTPRCRMGAGAGHDLLGDAAGAVLAPAGNALMTLNGAWHKVRDDVTLRFMMMAAVFYGLRPSRGRSWRSARSTRCRTTPTGRSPTCTPGRWAGSR